MIDLAFEAAGYVYFEWIHALSARLIELGSRERIVYGLLTDWLPLARSPEWAFAQCGASFVAMPPHPVELTSQPGQLLKLDSKRGSDGTSSINELTRLAIPLPPIWLLTSQI